jgi:general secretion pathway protein H
MLISVIGTISNNLQQLKSPLLSNQKSMNSSGFTLIELLLVIAILGVITSISIFVINTASKNDASRLISLIELSREEAIMQSRDYGIEFLDDGYQFLEYIPDLESWKIIINDNLFRKRKFSPNIQYDLYIENKAIKITEEQKNSKRDTNDNLNLERVPHTLILSSGDLNPFSLRLYKNLNSVIEISASLDGAINVTE